LAALVISDVLGDPLDLIASGPTVEDRSPPEAALAVLNRYGAREAGIDPRVFEALARRVGQGVEPIGCLVTNTVIGNNQTAVAAAGDEARRLGYGPAMVSAKTSEGAAEDVGRDLAEAAVRMLSEGPDCLASGGEPTVKLVDTARRGRGGRNQQLVLSAALQLEAAGGEGIVILSGGTDGEDGPTDAAGAWVDRAMIDEARRLGLEARDFLQRNDAYRWFDPLGGLIKTGPTDTNVCDLRVVLVDRIARET
jgi:hydroxypyruvate reductase